MGIFKPSELLKKLEELGVNPKKGLSQNFLIDGNILNKIVDLAEVKPGDKVLEIGPGPGALTEKLLERGAHLIAVEKDSTWARALKEKSIPELSVHEADILEFDLSLISPGTKVVANLPYHITTPILSKLVERSDLFQSITVMVQDEVAKRMTSKPKTSDYSSLTVYLSFFSEPKYGFKVKRTSFFPPPNVDSAIVRLDIKVPRAISNKERFFKMVREAFNHRRKMLRASLRTIYTKELLEKHLPNPNARPEEMSIDELIILFESLEKDL